MPTEPIDPNPPLFIVINVRSGNRDTERTVDTLREVFEQAGRAHRFISPEGSQTIVDAARRAVRQAQDCNGVVVAAGGDGTINGVAQAVLGSGCVFGVIPLGTFNLFARTHGIPLEPAEAAQVLIRGLPQPVQAGKVNDHVFLVNASLGLYSNLLEDREAFKAQLGRSRLVAAGAGLRSLFREHRQLRLRLDQDGRMRSVRTPSLFVGNNRLQLDRLGVDEAPLVEQGRLVALVVRAIGTVALLGLAMRGALGRLGETENILRLPTRDLTVAVGRRRRIKVAVDGEILTLGAPLRFAVADTPLMLLKPLPQPLPEPDAA